LHFAKEIADLKAVSMNLMHSSIGITDSIYAVLSDSDMQERIARLGQAKTVQAGTITQTQLEAVVQRVLTELEQQNAEKQ
jgi:predicted nuclease of predicted toxin-antitoxin system